MSTNIRTLVTRYVDRGERAVLEALPSATILRPSIVFGPEDGFFNRFARMATTMPFLPRRAMSAGSITCACSIRQRRSPL